MKLDGTLICSQTIRYVLLLGRGKCYSLMFGEIFCLIIRIDVPRRVKNKNVPILTYFNLWIGKESSDEILFNDFARTKKKLSLIILWYWDNLSKHKVYQFSNFILINSTIGFYIILFITLGSTPCVRNYHIRFIDICKNIQIIQIILSVSGHDATESELVETRICLYKKIIDILYHLLTCCLDKVGDF